MFLFDLSIQFLFLTKNSLTPTHEGFSFYIQMLAGVVTVSGLIAIIVLWKVMELGRELEDKIPNNIYR